VLLAISRSKIDYIPGPGRGTPEEIDLGGAKVKFDTGKLMIKASRPFLSLTFKGPDGKNKTYNFAAFGSACPGGTRTNPNLVPVPAGGVCGVDSTNGVRISILDSGSNGVPLLVPRYWQQDLTTVLRTIQDAQRGAGK
jgi:hypothetical protein